MPLHRVRSIPASLLTFFLQPTRLLQSYSTANLRADIIAAGLFSAIVGAIVAALWGSSHHLQSGPTNALSLLVLSALLPIAAPNTPQYLVAAGMMAVMVGIFQGPVFLSG